MVLSAIHIIYVFTEFCLDLVSSAKRGVDSSKIMKLSMSPFKSVIYFETIIRYVHIYDYCFSFSS